MLESLNRPSHNVVEVDSRMTSPLANIQKPSVEEQWRLIELRDNNIIVFGEYLVKTKARESQVCLFRPLNVRPIMGEENIDTAQKTGNVTKTRSKERTKMS